MAGRTKMHRLTELLCTTLLLLCPMVITTVLSMVQVLCHDVPDVLACVCTILTVGTWLAAAIVTRLRRKNYLFHGPMPKTGLALSGLLLLSILFYILAFAVEQEVLELSSSLWAVFRLFGMPASVSETGIRLLLDCETGTSAMLTSCVYLLISFLAAIPHRDPHKKSAKPTKSKAVAR